MPTGIAQVARRPKWLWILAGCLVLAAFFALLAQWQFGRAVSRAEDQRQSAEQTENPKPLVEMQRPQVLVPGTNTDHLVTLSGEFLPDAQVVVDGRTQAGVEGFWVVTMFRVEGAAVPGSSRVAAIPVVRGWTADRAVADAAAAPRGAVDLTGRLMPTEGPEPAQAEPGHVRTLSTAQLVNMIDVDSYAAFVLPTQAAGPGAAALAAGLTPVPAPRQPDGGVNLQSLFYGVEWVAFALFALYIWYRLVRDEYEREVERDELAAAGGSAAVLARARGQRPDGTTPPDAAKGDRP